jgi:hypothetical protein
MTDVACCPLRQEMEREIWRFQGGVAEDSSLQSCYVVSTGKLPDNEDELTTICRNVRNCLSADRV